MSVDKLRDTFHVNRIVPKEITISLSAQSYRPEITQAIRTITKYHSWLPLQSICSERISPGPHPKYTNDFGHPCIKTKQIEGLLVSEADWDWVPKELASGLSRHFVKEGDILINLTGAGSIGRVGIYLGHDVPLTNQHIARLCVKPNYDSAYICAFLASWWGQRAIEQGVSGSTGQLNLVNDHVRNLPVLLPSDKVQKYIGDKVRQAELLRAWARTLTEKVDVLVTLERVETALKLRDTKTNVVAGSDISSRLDPKYYTARSMSVLEACSENSVPLRDLVTEINNGFESRGFVEDGIAYITVSEVSTGRICLNAVPRIPRSVKVPKKATINPNCLLVVRTGSIGTAAKVHPDDADAVISSDIICLRFNNSDTCAAVGAFLSSAAGKVIQSKVAIGAVQPHIGQDELMQIPIPKEILESESTIHEYLNLKELAIRCSDRLISAAKLLVEYLIDGRLSEAELSLAQSQLEMGDNCTDRTILSQLFESESNTNNGKELFSNLDEHYETLRLCDNADIEGLTHRS